VLTITVPGLEMFDEDTSTFFKLEEVVLELEHSLVSLSKWESIWEKAFLGPGEKTTEETLGYIECMTLTPGVSSDVYRRLSNENMGAINKYIESKQTATWFKEIPGASRNRDIITSEVIYYWMDEMKIDWEAQYWHLNRLFTLIKVHNEKNKPSQKKMGRAEMAAQRRALNEQRLAQMKTSG
jgi:hypothetical protein